MAIVHAIASAVGIWVFAMDMFGPVGWPAPRRLMHIAPNQEGVVPNQEGFVPMRLPDAPRRPDVPKLPDAPQLPDAPRWLMQHNAPNQEGVVPNQTSFVSMWLPDAPRWLMQHIAPNQEGVVPNQKGFLPIRLPDAPIWLWCWIAGAGVTVGVLLLFCKVICCRHQRHGYQPFETNPDPSTSVVGPSFHAETVLGRHCSYIRHEAISGCTKVMSSDIKTATMMSLSTLLYYLDILSDIYAMSMFLRHRQYAYSISNMLAIVAGHLVASSTTSTSVGSSAPSSPFSMMLMPIQLCRAAWKLVSTVEPLPIEAGERTFTAKYSRMLQDGQAKLQKLNIQLKVILHAEAFVEAPVNTLVQFYAAIHDVHLQDSSRRKLLISSAIGVLSATKALVSLDENGQVSQRVQTLTGHTFAYSIGAGCSMQEMVLLFGFRFVEVASRLTTLAVLQHSLRLVFAEAWWARSIMAGNLLGSSLLLASLTCLVAPRHLSNSVQSAVAFGGPLLQPIRAKLGTTSAATHYSIRCIEMLGAWAAIAVVSEKTQAGREQLRLATGPDWHLCLAGVFTIAFILGCVVVMAVASCKDSWQVRLQVGSQFQTGEHGAILWPCTDSSASDPTAVLYALGIGIGRVTHVVTSDEKTPESQYSECLCDREIPEVLEHLSKMKSQPTRFDFTGSESMTSTGWGTLLQSLAGAGVEEMVFRNCELDDEKAACISETLAGMKGTLKRLDFSSNGFLTCAGWRKLSEALLGAELEELVLANSRICVRVSLAVAELLAGARGTLKRVDFFGTRMTSDIWATLAEALLGAELEDLALAHCFSDDEEDVRAVAGLLAGARGTLKRLDFSGNRIAYPGWATLAEALVGAELEDLVLVNCLFKDVDISGVAGLLAGAKGTLKRLDLSNNRMTFAANWASMTSAANWATLAEALLGAELEDLVLAHCFYFDEGISAVAGLLAGARGTLKRLDFSQNSLNSADWAMLAEALLGAELEDLVLANCRFGEKVFPAVAGLLAGARGTLKRLDFSRSSLNSADWATLAEALAGAALVEVCFDSCGLDDRNFMPIAEVLGGMSATLTNLSIKHANLSRSGWTDGLSRMSAMHLVVLKLNSCSLPDDVLEGFLHEHTLWTSKLMSVDLRGNPMPRSFACLRASMASTFDDGNIAPRLMSSADARPLALWHTVVQATGIEPNFARMLPAPAMTAFVKHAPEIRHLSLKDITEELAEALRMKSNLCLNFREDESSVEYGKLAEALTGVDIAELAFSKASADVAQLLFCMKGGLKRLRLSDTRFADADWADLIEALAGAALEGLYLSNCDLTDEKALGLGEVFAGAKGSLKQLDLSENTPLTSAGWGRLFEALFGVGLEHLGLTYCDLDDEKASRLGELLPSMKDSLKSVHLGQDESYGYQQQLRQALPGVKIFLDEDEDLNE